MDHKHSIDSEHELTAQEFGTKHIARGISRTTNYVLAKGRGSYVTTGKYLREMIKVVHQDT